MPFATQSETNILTKAPSWARCVGALFFGVLIPFSLAPYNIWLLSLVAPCALAILLYTLPNTSSKKIRFLVSFAFGLGMFASGTSWVYVSIHDFGSTGPVLASIMTAMFVSFLALVFALPFLLLSLTKNLKPLLFCFAFASVWVLGEWSRSWLLTGFPWLYLGYAHADTLLRTWAPIAGVFSISFIAILSGTLTVCLLQNTIAICKVRKDSLKDKIDAKPLLSQTIICLVTLLFLWLTPYSLKDYRWTQAKDEIQSVALIQPNIELYKKWNPMYFPEIFHDLYNLSGEHWDKDIQVWPEAAIPSVYSHVHPFTWDINNKARDTQTHIFSGVLYDNDEPYEVYNSIIGLGLGEGTYFKQKLVPFGEYVPLEKQLRGLIDFFNLPNSVIRAGPFHPQALSAKTKSGYEYSVAPFICYEVVYPDFVAKNTADSSLLLTISNDAWFGESNGPLQHFEMVRMRALENQKYMLRATNTGVSGIIDEQGQVLNISEQFVATSIHGFVELREGSTPFSRTGSLPIILICFFSFAIALLQARANKSKTPATQA